MYHPGGSEILEKCLGRDGTRLFDRYHAWVNIENLIGPLLVGYLSKEERRRGGNADDEEGIGSKYLSKTVGGISDEEVVLPSARSATSESASEVAFAMPKPRPMKDAHIPSLLGKSDDDEDEAEEDLL